ncbi:MAG: hypothetical protein ACYTFG_22315, partial [Planctomycetota bacterium]
RRPYPELRIRPEARWNILLAHAGVGTGAGPGLPLDLAPWDYVALGYLHQHQQVAPRVFYPGSLERVGTEPWREAAQEKGFLTFDLESGKSDFHPIPGRAVVALAPIRIPHGESGKLAGKVTEVLGEVNVREEGQGLFSSLRDQALHLAVEVDDFQNVGEDNPLPLVTRDRGFGLRALRGRVEEAEGGAGEMGALLGELGGGAISSGDPPGFEEELLIREFHGSDLPYLGEMSLEAREGLLAWMGLDGRTLQALSSTLLWGVGINPDLPGAAVAEGKGEESKASVALRLGMREGSFWRRRGAREAGAVMKGLEGPQTEWSLPVQGIALAWCGIGADSPEDVLNGGRDVLAAARGVEELEALELELSERHPGLRQDRVLGDLSARDYERLRLESELADVRSQLRALDDVPDRLTVLETELLELRGAVAVVAGDQVARNMEWHRERQDAETHLLAYRDRAKELQARIRRLEALGPESPCPTCGRLLAEHFNDVLVGLKEEWEALVQDGKWWRRRWEQLEEKPQELIDVEGRSVRTNASFEDCAERLERTRSSLREMDELRVREKELKERLEIVRGEGEETDATLEELEAYKDNPGKIPETPAGARSLYDLLGQLQKEILDECRTRLLHRGGRRLNRLTGGRILGLELGEEDEVELVEGGVSAGVEADEDRAAAVVSLRMALVELLAEDWSPLGSFILGDPFDRMGAEDQLRALSLLRRILSRIPQVLLLTRGPVVERAPEFFDGLFDFREQPERGSTFL